MIDKSFWSNRTFKKDKTISIRLTEMSYARLKKLSDMYEVPMSEVISLCIDMAYINSPA